jgi:hypothetical protein
MRRFTPRAREILETFTKHPLDQIREAMDEMWSQPSIAVDLSPGQVRALEHLANEGLLGETIEEVVHYLIMRGIDDLWRAGVIPTIITGENIDEKGKS